MKLQTSIRPPASLAASFASRLGAVARSVSHELNREIGEWPSPRRVVDAVGSFIGLVAALPVLILAAIAIKATSKGSIFYAQERVGHRGQRFMMYKLRTMYVDADARRKALVAAQGASEGPTFKLRRDPRITAVGRILRKLSIDELPQIYNVLRGDMTIVGPRPALPREVDLYDPRALRRLEVKPGLTCLWQVGGRSDLTFAQQVELDLEYIDRTSVIDEIKIVARTVPAVLLGRGAY